MFSVTIYSRGEDKRWIKEYNTTTERYHQGERRSNYYCQWNESSPGAHYQKLEA